jgi:hypothetical protein
VKYGKFCVKYIVQLENGMEKYHNRLNLDPQFFLLVLCRPFSTSILFSEIIIKLKSRVFKHLCYFCAATTRSQGIS